MWEPCVPVFHYMHDSHSPSPATRPSRIWSHLLGIENRRWVEGLHHDTPAEMAIEDPNERLTDQDPISKESNSPVLHRACRTYHRD